MKTLHSILTCAAMLAGVNAFAKEQDEVEMTIMAMGAPQGGKLQAGATGCAVVHFLNRTKAKIYLPTSPRSLGLGRVANWNDASYLSPKQGKDYGWGYRAAHDCPKVKIEFLDKTGNVVHRDESIQMQPIDVIEARVWGFSPILFSTPSQPGSYVVRFSFDNTNMRESSGHSFPDPEPAKLVTLNKAIELEKVPVVADGVEPGVEIATLDELLAVLSNAKVITVTGYPPFDHSINKPPDWYSLRLVDSAELRLIGDFFKRAELRLNQQATDDFRDGAKIGTKTVTFINIDAKYTFHLMGSAYVVLADSLICNGPETPGPLWSYFHRDFALLLQRIESSRSSQNAKKKTRR